MQPVSQIAHSVAEDLKIRSGGRPQGERIAPCRQIICSDHRGMGVTISQVLDFDLLAGLQPPGDR